MPGPEFRFGRLLKAPENFIDSAGFSTVVAEAKAGRLCAPGHAGQAAQGQPARRAAAGRR